ncbi:MAG: helix-turn-helix transcriptional regulator [Treponema sp.]|jgi:LuxR family maltose regulon positive regulatory protein|nr:helix-turn-helix transcriptional regulator [Treponema sp.]
MEQRNDQFFYSNAPMADQNQIYLERPQIHDLLERAVQSPLVVVVAGAGYGKTHEVYSFVQQHKVHTIWLQLSERDNIDERFWENYTAAVATANKGVAKKLIDLGFPTTEQQLDRYLRLPQDSLASDQRYFFIYDDLHLVTDKAVLRFLELSVTAPFHVTSILISRAEPSLNLMKMASKGLLARITEEDLRFSREEMVSYFHLLNIRISPDTAASIYRDTEGWAFAIHLAGLTFRNQSSNAAYVPQALRVNIFKLIESEVMAPLKEELQRFLIKLSLVDHLALPLLVELADKSSFIEKIEVIGSLIRFDSYLNVYHIHHLFLDYLKGRQDELTAEEKTEAWTKAAAWCVANNQKLDALSYYEKAGAYDKLIEVVYEAFPLAMPNRVARFLLNILDRAPEDMYRRIPSAWVLRSHVLMVLELFDRAVAEIKSIIAALEAEDPTPLRCQVLSGCYNNLGIIGLTTSTYSRDYDYVRWFEKGYSYYRLSEPKFSESAAVASLSAFACRVSVPDKGEIEKYIEANAGMIFYTTRSMGGLYAGLDDLARAEYAFFKTEAVEAEQFAYKALHKAQEARQYEIENRALYYLIRISLYQGTYDKIPRYLQLLEAQLSQKDYFNRDTYYDIVTGGFYIRLRQSERIASWLKNDFEESDLNSLAYGLETMVRIKYHFYQKRYTAALALMTNQKGIYGYSGYLFGKISFKFMEALCLYRIKDIPGAVEALEAAYELESPNGLDMSFIEMGRDMAALVSAVLKEESYRESAGSGAGRIPREWMEKIRRASLAYERKISVAAGIFVDAGEENQNNPHRNTRI